MGQRCQAHSPCLSAPCRNGGTCHVLERAGRVDYACSCRLGFSGPLCLTPQDNACLPSPCRNGGSCELLTLADYKCLCPPGWSGEAARPPSPLMRVGWPGPSVWLEEALGFPWAVGDCDPKCLGLHPEPPLQPGLWGLLSPGPLSPPAAAGLRAWTRASGRVGSASGTPSLTHRMAAGSGGGSGG